MPSLSQRFPNLASTFTSNYSLVGLYFAASWCPDCTPVTPQLAKLYNHNSNSNNDTKLLQVVYIPSDSSEEQMKTSMKESHGSWEVIPFDCTEEIREIKRHFGACAAKEVEGLGMVKVKQKEDDVLRKHGLPTLIVLNARTEAVVTEDGVGDIMGEGAKVEEVLAKWAAAV